LHLVTQYTFAPKIEHAKGLTVGLIGSLFNRRPAFRCEFPDGADDVNALFIPLRNRVSDFKDATNMSWALILPAIQRMSIRLFVQARGSESMLKLLECMIRKIEEKRGIGPYVGRNITLYPDMSPEQLPQLAKLNSLLWQVANEAIANDRSVEHVARAFSGFVALIASRIDGQFEESYASELLHASYREVLSGAFNDRAVTSSRTTAAG
jgi:hypothetical protein